MFPNIIELPIHFKWWSGILQRNQISQTAKKAFSAKKKNRNLNISIDRIELDS
jgi:hypothetical protein